MDLLKKYLLTGVYRSPDEPAVAVADPVAAPDVVAVDPAEAAAEPAEVEPAVAEHPPEPANKKKPWFLDRISAEAEARRQAEADRDNYKALAERLQTPKSGDVPPPPVASSSSVRDFDAAVQAQAARLRFNDDCTAVGDAGFREFGASFNEGIAGLNAVGATSDDFLLDLYAVDKPGAHKILNLLAKDLEKAAALTKMDSRHRIAELTRMATPAPTATTEPKPPAAPPTKVSKAPAPPPPVTPSATTIVDWRSDKASDEEFTKGFNETMAKRAARR